MLIIAITFQANPITASPPTNPNNLPNVDPRVWQDTQEGQLISFIVLLKSQAKLSNAPSSPQIRAQKIYIVYESLIEHASTSQKSIIAWLKNHSAKYNPLWIINALVVEGNRDLIYSLALRDDILGIESNRTFPVQLEQHVNQSRMLPPGIAWNIAQIRAPELWNSDIRGKGVVYANADTGVQWDHPALIDQYRGWDGFAVNHNYNWWDAVKEDLNGNLHNPCGFDSREPCDDYGHGTHTLGIGVGEDGPDNLIGVAPESKWIACRNMDEGWGKPSVYLSCLQFFLAPTDLDGNNPDPSRHADVVGNSYICPPEEGCAPQSMKIAIENMRSAGIFMSVSAGNNGPSCETINHPPALEEAAITVGAIDHHNLIANFSSRGPVTVDNSQRLKPDLVAPGVSVRSSSLGNFYSSSSGTSMAAPHVAGTAALLWSRFAHLRGDVEATEMLITTAANPLTSPYLCGGDTEESIPNHVYGFGLVDAYKAYQIEFQNLYPYANFFPWIRKSN